MISITEYLQRPCTCTVWLKLINSENDVKNNDILIIVDSSIEKKFEFLKEKELKENIFLQGHVT